MSSNTTQFLLAHTNPLPNTVPKLQFITLDTSHNVQSPQSRKTVRAAAARNAHSKARLARVIEYQRAQQVVNGRTDRSGAENDSTEDDELVRQRYLSGAQTNPSGSLRYGRQDPFSVFPVQCGPFEYELLHHYVNYILPGSTTHYTPLSPSFCSLHYSDLIRTQWVKFLMSEPGLMNGLFLVASRSLSVLYPASYDPSNLNKQHDKYSFAVLKYKSVCLQAVREALVEDGDSPASDGTIAKVLVLASDEFCTGNIKGTKSHTEAVGSMVRMKGGLGNLGLDGLLQEMVLWNDRTITFYTNSNPTFSNTLNLPGSSQTQHLTPGFLASIQVNNNLFSAQFVEILNEICFATTAASPFCSPNFPNRKESPDFVSRLLDVASEHHTSSSDRLYSPLEECLCLALLIFINQNKMINPFPGLTTVSQNQEREMRYITSTIGLKLAAAILENGWQDHFELVLWMAVMGAWFECEGRTRDNVVAVGGGMEENDLFCVKLVVKLLGPRPSTVEDLEARMREFLWVDSLCGLFLRRLWKGLLDGNSVVEIIDN